MNMNYLINMIMRMFIRKVVNRGMDAGIDMVAKRHGAKGEQTAEQKQASQDTSRRAKDVMRTARRIGRL